MKRIIVSMAIYAILLTSCNAMGDTAGKNFSGQTTPAIIDTEYASCNFSQPQPNTDDPNNVIGVRIFPGDDTPRIFRNCNLINCIVPPGSTVIKCNTAVVEYDVVIGARDYIIDGQGLTINIIGSRIWRNGQSKVIGSLPSVPVAIDTTTVQYQQLLTAVSLLKSKLQTDLMAMEYMTKQQRKQWLQRDELLKETVLMCIKVSEFVNELKEATND